jgi:hypothetical protein
MPDSGDEQKTVVGIAEVWDRLGVQNIIATIVKSRQFYHPQFFIQLAVYTAKKAY